MDKPWAHEIISGGRGKIANRPMGWDELKDKPECRVLIQLISGIYKMLYSLGAVTANDLFRVTTGYITERLGRVVDKLNMGPIEEYDGVGAAAGSVSFDEPGLSIKPKRGAAAGKSTFEEVSFGD